ncbi:MAG: mandelate racemase [Candidatus Tectomicrobia bacterium]|nr:mandelate racemase [Candidatus Tectomicrobia bacterium]
MKITDVTLTMVRWTIEAGSYSRRLRFGGEQELGVLTVHTDEVVEGHAFLGSASRGAQYDAEPLLTHLKPLLLDQNPLDLGRLWHAMWGMNRFVSLRAIGALDVALWDLAGKVANLPIHRLLGSCRDRVPAYASSAYLPSREAYADEAVSYRSQGWTAYKIHPPADPQEDIAICQAIRKAVGDKMVLMLDSVWAYNYEEALRVGRAIEDLDFFWYEDPLPEDDIYGCVKLRNKLDIPLLATEYTPGGLYGLQQFILQGATDMLRGDVAVKGGITALMKIAHLAEAFRMKCEIHHGGNSLNNVANLHVTMAVNNCDYYEMLLPRGAQEYGLVEEVKVDSQGYVHAPEKPGLGYEIDWDLVKQQTTRVLK